jgi:4-hydroxybenzoate polyprenyltransferase/phosphoserine phosphatase
MFGAPDASRAQQTRPTVCVDLDGTLIAGDLMWESLLLLIKRAPLAALMVPLWMLRGRAFLKHQIAMHVTLDPGTLLYRDEVLAFLRHSHSQGRSLVLATGADEIHARAIATHLGIFSDVLASDGRRNLSGRHKAARLAERFGAHRFDYLGNAWADVPSWLTAGRAIVVAAPARLLQHLKPRIEITSVLASRPALLRSVVRAMRPHQWVKNLLVFVPAIGAHRLFDVDAVRPTVFTLVAFSLCASAIYVANDMLDIHADRQHPRKRHRPFAAGELSIPVGAVMSVSLTAMALGVAVAGVSWSLALTLLGYVAANAAYSFRLKREPVADVFLLTALYELRIVAGAVATSIPLSTWLLAFALFFFLSLACVKRYLEVSANPGAVPGRGYTPQDALWMHSIGTSSGYMAILVLALYVNSPEVMRLYTQPHLLWILCPVLLYWLSRLWFAAGRGKVHDDPVVEAVHDPMSYVAGAVSAAVVLAAL